VTRLLWSIWTIGLLAQLFAQEPSLSMTVDRNPVGLGERFRLTISLEGSRGDIIPPALDDFQIIAGPSVSNQMSIVNGRTSSSTSHVYFLSPKTQGEFTLSPAKARTSKATLESSGLTIKVTEGKGKAAQTPQASSSGSENCFIRIYVDKNKVSKGEHLVATYVLYNRYQGFELMDYEFPSVSGFWKEDIELGEIQWADEYENVGGRAFKKAVMGRQVLFPQKSGELSIGPFELTARVGRSFFRSGQEIKKRSNTVTVQVDPLPSAPGGFQGAVGQFQLEASLEPREVLANEPITLKMTISGNGNLQLVEPPELDVPGDFERYDPEVKKRLKTNGSGVSGSKTFEYLLIPRYAGTYDLEAIDWVYFDPKKKDYIRKQAGPFTITVEGNGEASPATGPVVTRKQDVESVGSDIRYIHDSEWSSDGGGNQLAGTTWQWAGITAPFLILGLFIAYRRRQDELSADVVGYRKRQAGKVASRHLKDAKKALDKGVDSESYLALYQAMNEYGSQKFSIPMAELDHQRIRQAFEELGLDASIMNRWMAGLEACEMARYAPSGVRSPQELFTDISGLIGEIEGAL